MWHGLLSVVTVYTPRENPLGFFEHPDPLGQGMSTTDEQPEKIYARDPQWSVSGWALRVI